MSTVADLIGAASHKSPKLSAGRKAKITEHVKKFVPKEQKKVAQKAIDHVLDKDDASAKNDAALITEIKAALKGTFYVTSAARLIEAAGTATQVYTLGVNDGDGALWRLLDYLKKCGDDGHSVSFKIDDQSFGFDGDGADKIVTMDRDESP